MKTPPLRYEVRCRDCLTVQHPMYWAPEQGAAGHCDASIKRSRVYRCAKCGAICDPTDLGLRWMALHGIKR